MIESIEEKTARLQGAAGKIAARIPRLKQSLRRYLQGEADIAAWYALCETAIEIAGDDTMRRGALRDIFEGIFAGDDSVRREVQ